ncbi:MAG TPA: squalene--hopene cyclase [Steroidobacteraceae bacterium]|nr:squalene--hopene cyclase [Steroidobacteraceae bacterium]
MTPGAQAGAAQFAGPLAAAEIARARAPRPLERLGQAIGEARDALIGMQKPDGHWLFELEADCTIPAEYILMMHYLDEIEPQLECKLAVYLREHQAAHGGWPLYHGGELDLSCTVKVYYALKLAGDDTEAPHMRRAREAILARGGAAHVNVFTRIALALFGEIPWRAVPYIPVEIMLMPRWFPFHIDRVSYWSRTVMVPLFVLCTLKPVARNPQGVHVRELFTRPPAQEHHYFQLPGKGKFLARVFFALDRVARYIDPLIPAVMRNAALRRAEAWVLERLNGEDGLGAIFPAMVNALEMMVLLGYPPDDPRRVTAKRAIEKLLVDRGERAYCQPCVSPIWDTALAALAMQEVDDSQATRAAVRALDWLLPRQVLQDVGDWRACRPQVPSGGWAFQYANAHYPDLDDTAVVGWAMHQAHLPERYAGSIGRALDWLVGMQSENGGFAAFDADNTHYNLNYIPFADHGALLDPPTSDVTARVVSALSRARRPQDRVALERAIAYLRREQEADGSWFGRWGTNYVYGTWSVLMALELAGIPVDDPAVRRAVAWLFTRQNADGGWGESNDSYSLEQDPDRSVGSTAYHTGWAVLGLIAAGEDGSPAVRRGIDYLLRTQESNGLWSHPSFTAPGFPRVFYLKYHGYCAFFPLWALAAYRRRAEQHPT